MSPWHELIHLIHQPKRSSTGLFDIDENDLLLLQSYLGYGTAERAFILGRVLEDRGIA